MTLLDIDNDIQKKINENVRYIRFSYFELKVKRDLSDEDINIYVKLARNKLENLGYKVYLQGERFVFDNANRIVDTNECLIAIKEN